MVLTFVGSTLGYRALRMRCFVVGLAVFIGSFPQLLSRVFALRNRCLASTLFLVHRQGLVSRVNHDYFGLSAFVV